jgi:hypothetical protein
MHAELDPQWLLWLVRHPEEWSPDDLVAAEQIVADQKRVIAEAHAQDVQGHLSKQIVVDGLEAAIGQYRDRHRLVD